MPVHDLVHGGPSENVDQDPAANLAGIKGEIEAALKEAGIGTQVHYLPLHMQPYYRDRYGEMSLPGAEVFYEQALSLPLFPDMTEEEVDYVVEMLGEITGAAT